MFFKRIHSCFASPRAWLFLLLCFHLAANVWWLKTDNHAVSTDEETHMIMAREYYNALFPRVGDRGLAARVKAVAAIRPDVGNPMHPPLLHVLGALLARIVGYSVDVFAFANTLAFLAAVLGVYRLARFFLEAREALFAAFVFSFTPMVYAASRYFMTDFLSMALVVWVMYALARCKGFTRLGWSAAFAVLNGFALLARTTAVLYYFVPALVVFAGGLYLVFRHGENRRSSLDAAAGLLANAIIVVILSAVVCGPWYLVHGRQFYAYWMDPSVSGKSAALAITRSEPEAERDAGKEAAVQVPEEASSKGEEKAQAEAPARGKKRLALLRRIPWVRYPVFVINNAVFLPMFCLFLLGVPLCAACGRFRKRALPWLLLCWVLGSYVLLTLLLSYAAPRYALQALPALAVISALPVLALPRGLLRRALQCLYAAVLLFQYGNLTVHAYAAAPEAKIAVYPDREFQKAYADPGLYFYKSVLHGSFSYARLQAPTKENFKDRLFFAMLREEQKQPYCGIEANYVRLNIRGMLLDQEHFWLDNAGPNPFRRRDLPPELTPYRNLKNSGWGKKFEDVQPILGMTDYVAYTTEGITEEKEKTWLEALAAEGFTLVERFQEPRSGLVPARYFGLLAHAPRESLPEARTISEIKALDLESLYKLRHSAAFSRLTPELREMIVTELRSRLEQEGASVPLKDHVDFYNARVEHEADDVYRITLFLYNRQAMPRDYRLLLQGRVSPEVMALYFNDHTGNHYEYQLAGEPMPSTRLWPENEPVIVRMLVGLHPVPTQLSIALYGPGGSILGNIINLGGVDLPGIRRSAEQAPGATPGG